MNIILTDQVDKILKHGGTVPFKSDAQRKFLYAKHPEVAKKFAEHSGKQGSALPSKVTPPVKGSNR